MHKIHHRLLTALLSLLLGLAPLQGAFAGELAGESSAMAMIAQVSDSGMSMDMADHDCSQCDINKACSEADCPAGHCAVSVPASAAYAAASSVVAHAFPFMATGQLSTRPTGLFRPPRA